MHQINNNSKNHTRHKSGGDNENVPDEKPSTPLSSSSSISGFYPYTPFTSWKEFFTMQPTTTTITTTSNNSGVPPSSSLPPAGTYVGTRERIEMAASIIFLFYIVIVVWGGNLHYISYNVGKFLDGANTNADDAEQQRAATLSALRLSTNSDDAIAEGNPYTVYNFLWYLFFPKSIFPLGYDVADEQWRTFNSNLLSLIFGLLVYVGLSRLARLIAASPAVQRFFPEGERMSLINSPTTSNIRSSSQSNHPTFLSFFLKGTTFHLAFLGILNLIIIFLLHGWGFFVLIPILLLHYSFTVYIGPRIPRWLFLTIMWASLIALLLNVEWKEGFEKFMRANFPIAFTLAKTFGLKSSSSPNGKPLILWNSVFNMQMLRMVAFSVDYLEARDRGEARRHEVELRHRTTCYICGEIARRNNSNNKLIASEIQPLCYKARTDTPRAVEEYTSFINFIAYILYLPLYIGGPISSFNAFISHIRVAPQQTMNTTKELARYAFRTACLYFCLMLLLHTIFVNSLREQQSSIKDKLSSLNQNGLMYYMLAFLWLKFSVIWKGFRFFGLLDGVESPEDMQRCFSNTVRVAEFWRDWHASFNLWIVRYMYIPLGGNKNKALVVFPIFFFIAIWHDSKLELLGWAMVICVNFALELLLTSYCSKLPYWKQSGPSKYRYWVTFGGVYTILALIVSNSIGFGTGSLSTQYFLDSFNNKENLYMAVLWTVGCFCSCTVSLVEREMAANRVRKATDELNAALSSVAQSQEQQHEDESSTTVHARTSSSSSRSSSARLGSN